MDYRFKYVRKDGTHYFKVHYFLFRGSVFTTASIRAEHTADIDHIDVYEDDRKIATFYK